MIGAIVLALLLDSPAAHAPKYNRTEWNLWIDEDHDCQDTRQEVLIRESRTPAKLDRKGCRVVSGTWIDPYSGKTFTSPKQIDIDHVVPLGNAARSGGQAWSRARKQAYANDLVDMWHLRAVSSSLNRQKGDKGPEAWMPPDARIWCAYIQHWDAIKKRWGLTETLREHTTVVEVERQCASDNPPPRSMPLPAKREHLHAQ